MTHRLFHGDCLDVMRAMPEASVDTIITDPPYGLEFMGKDWDAPWQASSQSALFGDRKIATPGWECTRNPTCRTCGGRLRGAKRCDCPEPKWDQSPHDTFLKQAQGFQDWTADWAREALRVTKPGGFLLAFGGTRMFHRLICGLEDAEWEVRDCLMWLYGCLSEDTECLTSTGWKHHSQIRPDDRVLQWDHATGRLSWTTPTAIHRYPFDGELVHLKNRHVDQLLTPNHRVYARVRAHNKKPAGYGVHLAGDLKEHENVDLPVAGVLDSGRHVDAPDRELTWDILGWDFSSREALLEGLMDGDGTQPSNQHAKTFWSKKRSRLDVFQALVLSLGYRSHIDYHKGCVYINRRATTQLQSKHHQPPVRYSGMVWCLTVKSGAFVVRRNGSAFITGNSGFPKSLDISKAIDKAAGAKREVVGTKKITGRGGDAFGYGEGKTGLKAGDIPITAPATDDAKRWRGYGTALKPAWEPIVVAMKPCDGTFAQNALKHGVAGLNIDGCRIAYEKGGSLATNPSLRTSVKGGNGGHVFGTETESREMVPHAAGRWPANVALDSGAAAIVDEQSGESKSRIGKPRASQQPGAGWGMTATGAEYDDEGGASRFFLNTDSPGRWPPNVVLDNQAAAQLDAQAGERPGCRSPSAARPESKFRPGQGNYQPQGPIYPDTGGASRFFNRADDDEESEARGRWPANVVMDESAAAHLDEQSGILTSGTGAVKRATASGYQANAYGKENRPPGTPNVEYGDSGGASRFFQVCKQEHAPLGSEPGVQGSRMCYCAKAAKSERGKGNDHPTVKPLKLMAWLCSLTNPPGGGNVFDPFMGSGTTGKAAARCGRPFIGVEKDKHYFDIAVARISEEGARVSTHSG